MNKKALNKLARLLFNKHMKLIKQMKKDLGVK